MAVQPGEKPPKGAGAAVKKAATVAATKPAAKKTTTTATKTTTAPAKPAAPTSQQIDWNQLLGSDQTLASAVAQAQDQDRLNKLAEQQTQWQSLIGYGAVPDLQAMYDANPDGFKQLYGGTPAELFPDSVSQAAQQATEGGISTLAGLKTAYENSQRGLGATLAERGILHSGGYLSGSNANLQARNVAQSKAATDELNSLAAAYQGYLGQKQGLDATTAQATQDATNRIIAGINNGLYTQPATGATGGSSGAAPNAKPTGVTAAARATQQANAGYLSPNPVLGVDISPTVHVSPAGPAAAARARSQISAGYLSPMPRGL